MDKAPWLAYLVADFLDRRDRFSLALVSHAFSENALPRLYEHVRARDKDELVSLADRVVKETKVANRVRVLELASPAVVDALLSGHGHDLLTECPRIRQLDLQLTLSVGSQKEWIGEGRPPGILAQHRLLLAKRCKDIKVLSAALPTIHEASRYPASEYFAPLILFGFLIEAVNPRAIYMRDGCLSSTFHFASALTRIEITRSVLLVSVLSQMLNDVRSNMTIRLVDVRLQVTCTVASELPTARDQPSVAWIDLAHSHARDYRSDKCDGAQLIVGCTCGLSGQRAHLPGGHRGEAVPNLRVEVARTLEKRGVMLVIEDDIPCTEESW